MSDFESCPCDSCSKHYPDECPTYTILKYTWKDGKLVKVEFAGCDKFVGWTDSITEHYIP